MPVEFKDYYQTLGVAKTASAEEIKRAFRKLAMQHHPDKARGDKRLAEERFKDINEAYEVLGDPAKRQKYDALGEQWNQPGGFHPPPAGSQAESTSQAAAGPGGFEFHFGGTGFSDFFEQFFGGGRGRSPFGFGGAEGMEFGPEFNGRGRGVAKGADIEGDLLVRLEEALQGATREISVQKRDARTGRVETQTYRVRVPAGVREGQLIRLAGRGHEGQGGAGDLYLRVKFARHPDYRLRGADLYHDLALAPWEAVLGARVTVPTLDGAVSLNIPAGTTAGQQLRLRGRGLPRENGGRGDLYVVIRVEVPAAVGPAERELWQQLRQRSKFQPRSAA